MHILTKTKKNFEVIIKKTSENTTVSRNKMAITETRIPLVMSSKNICICVFLI